MVYRSGISYRKGRMLIFYHSEFIESAPYGDIEPEFMEVESWEEFYKKLLSNPLKYELIYNSNCTTYLTSKFFMKCFNLEKEEIPLISEKEFIEKYVDISKWKELKTAFEEANHHGESGRYYHIIKIRDQ